MFAKMKALAPLVVLVGASMLAAQPTGASTAKGHSLAWRIWPSATPGGSANIVDVVAMPQKQAWAVGFTAPDVGGFGTVALHEADGRWIRVRTPNPDPVSNRLDSVDGVASNDLWAVGSRQSGDDGTLVEHWNGMAWSVVPSPSPHHRFSWLDGVSVASESDAWAVGASQSYSGSSTKSLIEHWDGRRWAIVPSPNPGDYNFLLDVSARSATDAWAVGSSYDAAGAHNLVMHWDGAKWATVRAPSPGQEDNTLESVITLDPHDAWAVGNSADHGVSSRTPTTLHWDGNTWDLVRSPALSGQLNDVAAERNGRLWAVGYREVPPKTLVERWDGSVWRVVSSEDPSGSEFGGLFGVAVGRGSGTTWAVGSAATTGSALRTLIERPCREGLAPASRRVVIRSRRWRTTRSSRTGYASWQPASPG